MFSLTTFSLSGLSGILHQVLKAVLHGVERTTLLGPHEGGHPCLPGSASLHHVFDRAEDFLVAANGVLDACSGTSESVLLECGSVCLNCVHGILQLSHVILQGLQSHLNHGGDAGKQSDIVGNSSQCLHFLESTKCLQFVSSSVLCVLGLLGETVSLAQEIGDLLGDASFECVYVVNKCILHVLC